MITIKEMFMLISRKEALAIFAATAWIGASEFFRNELLLKSFWLEKYRETGLVFPDQAINGMVWGLWSLLFATAIFVIAKKFTGWQTIFFSWYIGFVLMWVVIGNLGVLPFGILVYALPLSFIEVCIATAIVKKIA
jgi:hypothetical protein